MTDSTPQTMSKSEFARHLGNSPSYVTKLRKADRLVLTDDGKKVKVAESLQLIEDTKDPNRDDVAARHTENRKSQGEEKKEHPGQEKSEQADLVDQAEQEAQNKTSQSYTKSRAEKEHFAARTAELEFNKLIGQSCETDEVKTAGDELGLILRSALEILPDQLAPQLAPISDEARVYALMAEHIENTLAEIARRIEGMVKTMTKAET